MNAIFHRVSIRKYESTPVEEEKITTILRAAMAAPSACNQQPWEFYVVRDKETIEKLSKVSPFSKFLTGAPMVLVTAYREDVKVPQFAHIDLAICMENIWLETTAQGLGGCWIGIAPVEKMMERLEEIIPFPEGQRAFAMFPMGYPAESGRERDDFDESRIHYI